MNRVRKMMLVPENELLTKLKLGEARPESKAAVGVEQAMKNVLKESDVPDDVKAKLFSELLQQLLAFRTSSKPVESEPKADVSVTSAIDAFDHEPIAVPETHDEPRVKYGVQDVYDELGKKLKPGSRRAAVLERASHLLHAIGPYVDWGPHGELLSESGEPLAGSSGSELVYYALNSSRAKQPIGWSRFYKRLQELRVPSSLVPRLKLRRLTSAAAASTSTKRTSLKQPWEGIY